MIGPIQQWSCTELGIQGEGGDAMEEMYFMFHSQLNLEMGGESGCYLKFFPLSLCFS